MNNNYRILHGESFSELENKVNKLIEIGFEPTGGIHIIKDHYNPVNLTYSQAMYKKQIQK